MTRADLIKKISEVYPYMHARNVEKVVSIIIGTITNALKNEDKVELRGFGTFSVKKRGKTKGRNPKTGEEVVIESKNVPFFKAGKKLKDVINGRLDKN
ncbi:MAG: integration host factor subunit beta [Holosporaceae bacterium]|jgi:integration host factor subunit beta|nr:integration host factor subunit beta [Holosporaceae bacterium]